MDVELSIHLIKKSLLYNFFNVLISIYNQLTFHLFLRKTNCFVVSRLPFSSSTYTDHPHSASVLDEVCLDNPTLHLLELFDIDVAPQGDRDEAES